MAREPQPRAEGYGMGWISLRGPSGTVLECEGEDPGYYGYMARVPERGLFVAMLSNTDFQLAPSTYHPGRALLALALGQPYDLVALPRAVQ